MSMDATESSATKKQNRIWVHQEAIASLVPDRHKPVQRRKSVSGSGLPPPEKTEWGWKEAYLVHQDDKDLLVQVVSQQDGESSPSKITLPSSALTTGLVLLANEYAMDEGTGLAMCPHDLIQLAHLHEPSVVECLQQRFFQGTVYTRTGPILIAINPFRSLSHLYNAKIMAQYWDRAEGNSCNESAHGKRSQQQQDEDLPPHVFEIADHAFRQMQRALDAQIHDAHPVGCEQSILVSGESGAGKTVTTKFVMKYLATLSERLASQRNGKGRKKVLRVRKGTSTPSINPSGRFSHTCKKVVAQPMWSMASAIKDAPKSPGVGLGKTPISPGIGLRKDTIPPISPGGFLKAPLSPAAGLPKLPSPSLDGSSTKTPPKSKANSTSASSMIRVMSGELDAVQKLLDTNNGIEAQVLQCNPILESFGNARTVRNDNSSRFGKFIEIQFTRLGKLVGAQIETYLLEKVRVVQQNAGERNYHAFYELLLGETSDEELKLYHLTRNSQPTDFRVTSSGTNDRRDNVSDADTYQEVRRAMDTMNFSLDEQRSIWALVAAILHGSNLDFDEVDEVASLERENANVDAFCDLMGLAFDDLEAALCTSKVFINKNLFERRLTATNAEKGLEALLKATYGALFNYLVDRINDSIACRSTEDALMRPVATIGVLDIFGFESFTTNTFEQLCINFCNETLQQQFNSFVLENEQAEYEREGINWSFIEFPGNQDVIDLIEKRGQGILSILDDHCRTPSPKDKAYALDVYKLCGDHPRFSATKKQTYSLEFSVVHYAGPVEYTMEGFTEKNCDVLPKETTDLLKSSSNALVQKLSKLIETCHDLAPVESMNKQAQARKPPCSEASGQRSTVGEQFRRQLKNLKIKIDKTEPHFIRCLKPNMHLQPETFDTGIISEQLKCGGILEAVRVSRAGFAQHYSHAKFIARYGWIGGIKGARAGQYPTQEKARADCEKLVRKLSTILQGAKTADTPSIERLIQLGKTKVFLSKFAFETLEKSHGKRQEVAATTLNSIFRRYLARAAFPALLRAYREEVAEGKRRESLEREARERRQKVEREARLRKGSAEGMDEATQPAPSHFEYDKLRNFAEEVAKRKRETASESVTGEFKWVQENGQWIKRQIQSDPVKDGEDPADEDENPAQDKQDVEQKIELTSNS